MNQMQAGLPNQVDRSVVSVAQIGDLKALPVATRLAFTDDSGYWLRSSTMLAWNSKFNALMKNHIGLCMTEYPTVSIAPIANSPTWTKHFYVGGNYVFVGGDGVNNSNNWARSGATTAVATDRKSDLTGNGLALNSAAKIGSNVVIVGVSGGSDMGAMTSASGGAWSVLTGPGSTDSFAYVASNDTNLMMLVKSASALNAADAIHTSTNGTSTTGRTGTGGSQVMHGVYWSPCSAAFLVVGTTSLFKAADGFTFSTPTLPADVASMAAPFATNDFQGKKGASSATSTVIILTDGRLLRTTDGTNFVAIEPSINYQAQVGSNRWIMHDGTKYIMCINNTQGNLPAFVISNDDGVTWIPSVSWGAAAVSHGNTIALVQNMPSIANSLTIWTVPTPTGSQLVSVWDITGMISTSRVPDKVGLMSAVSPNQYVKVA